MEKSEVFTPDYIPINNFNSLAFKLWEQIYKNMMEKNITPINLMKLKIKDWTDSVKLMIEKDGRTEDQIYELGLLEHI